ncbi:MAG: 30S ribosomal protein S24e [Candidatus Heimdallarchaeota archaeon]|nr:MAG: 30S ribosomal protein S24e [Candidatus Heimdallarchaeota archaeon]
METTIIQEKYNPLIGRKEVDVLLTHLGEITPSRESVRAKIAALLNLDLENVVIQSIQGHFGEPRSRVIVHCYDNADDVMIFEPKYRLKRNKIIEGENTNKS